LAYAEVGVRNANDRQMKEALRLLSTVPAGAAVLSRLADLYSRAGDRQRAYQLYSQALPLDSKSPLVLVNLGALEAERGNSVRAIELWRAALDGNPALVEAAANLSNILRASDQPVPGLAAQIERAKKIERGLLP
jgi:tetratricopeptide (TPR) repeat protein